MSSKTLNHLDNLIYPMIYQQMNTLRLMTANKAVWRTIVRQAFAITLGVIVAVWLTMPSYAADPTKDVADAQRIAEELKAFEDPTILKPRVWLDTEWNTFKDGTNNVDLTLGGLWTWAVSANQDWAVRLKVPLLLHFAGNADTDSDTQDLGDIKLGTGTAFRLSESWRIGGGLELRFPTTTDHDPSNDQWRVQLLGAIAWDITRQFTFSPSFEYNKSFSDEHGAVPKDFLEMFFPITYLLPGHWSVTARYEAKVDFENDNTLTQSAKLQVAKQLDRLPLGFALSIKKTFDGGDKKFQVNFVSTYYLW